MINMTENDFGVIMRPVLQDAEWDGDIQVSVFSNIMPDLDDEAHGQLMFLAYKMAAMIQFCTENEDFDDALDEYTNSMVDTLDAEESTKEEPKSRVVGKTGNVITLDFNTKCEGEG
tara:strand:+ start:217 stop:564 length:348 start_codon:yes stop_codon:yes gene_type:complete